MANAAEWPEAAIRNGQVEAKLYLPDAQRGFYKGTRFDWSGVIHSLQYAGHDFYGPWFTKADPPVHDFIYRGDDIIAGAASAVTGPADEFRVIGFDEAKHGGTFLKIGVGMLRKPDEQPYDAYRAYEMVDGGHWTVAKKADAVEFTQVLGSVSAPYAYTYRKAVKLAEGKPQLLLEHELKNTGKTAIHSDVYNHNFLTLDAKPLKQGIIVSFPFNVQSPKPPDAKLAEIRGKQIAYLSDLKDKDVVAAPIEGFNPASAADHHVRIENKALGAGMTIQGDKPLSKASLWSIRSVLAVEPFIAVSVEPGEAFRWTTTYDYFTLQ